MRGLLFLLAALAMVAFAADVDVTGNWKASVETPNGSMDLTYVLKSTGNVVTGTIQSQMGEMKIDDGGKIDGDKISFSVTIENIGKISYSGTVKGDEMTLNFTFGGGGDMPPMPAIVAKRVK